ncbi:phage head spike fiber domain-containing protein [Burkholderia gladioli]|uniref:phage head spike fiber domain-containing protein n=1 Tax=Burkholderia gladioli TaxID=28095 RepID=UPI0016403BB3|nr:hypothetical protein [Burkholderia gladioli]
MSVLTPIDPPSLAPLQNSAERDDFEAELKALFISVFESMIRDRERRLNLYGMPHLGDDELIQRALKNAGLSLIRRDTTRQSFLLKAALARNPRRGLIFLRQYLQSAWPNVWTAEPLWHPVALADQYPQFLTPRTSVPIEADVRADYDIDSNEDLPTIYRTDWQGEMQLYSTPRTNLCAASDITAPGWSPAANVTTVSDRGLIGPDGQSPASSYQGSGATNDVFVNSTAPALEANTWYTASVWMRLVDGAPPTDGRLLSVGYSADGTGSESRADVHYSETPLTVEWRRFSVTFLNVTAGTYSLYVHADTLSTAIVSPGGLMFEKGQAVTRLIRTTGQPASVTDYAVDAQGIATFDGGYPSATPVTHFLTGRIRVTIPASSDNGLGLDEIGKAFRSTLAPRLMLELRLSTILENVGQNGGIGLANGATAVMPLMAIGTLS